MRKVSQTLAAYQSHTPPLDEDKHDVLSVDTDPRVAKSMRMTSGLGCGEADEDDR